MILILPNIKNSKLMNFRSLKPLSNSTLAAMEFAKKFKDDFKFTITQVIGLTNDDEVSKEFRPYKQMIERLNRTYKATIIFCAHTSTIIIRYSTKLIC